MRRLREGQEDERRRKLEELKQHVRAGGRSDLERPIVTGHDSRVFWECGDESDDISDETDPRDVTT